MALYNWEERGLDQKAWLGFLPGVTHLFVLNCQYLNRPAKVLPLPTPNPPLPFILSGVNGAKSTASTTSCRALSCLRALVVMKCFLMFNLYFPLLSIIPLLIVKCPQIKPVTLKCRQVKPAYKFSWSQFTTACEVSPGSRLQTGQVDPILSSLYMLGPFFRGRMTDLKGQWVMLRYTHIPEHWKEIVSTKHIITAESLQAPWWAPLSLQAHS